MAANLGPAEYWNSFERKEWKLGTLSLIWLPLIPWLILHNQLAPSRTPYGDIVSSHARAARGRSRESDGRHKKGKLATISDTFSFPLPVAALVFAFVVSQWSPLWPHEMPWRTSAFAGYTNWNSRPSSPKENSSFLLHWGRLWASSCKELE